MSAIFGSTKVYQPDTSQADRINDNEPMLSSADRAASILRDRRQRSPRNMSATTTLLNQQESTL